MMNEMIAKYGLAMNLRRELCITNRSKKPTAEDMTWMKANKTAIIAELDARKAAKEAAEAARIAAEYKPAGLEEIKSAIAAEENHRYAFNRAMDRGDGILPESPKTDIAALKSQHPEAAMMLRAESMASKSNYEMAAIGRRAVQAIKDHTPAAEAIAKMEAELKELTAAHAWD